MAESAAKHVVRVSNDPEVELDDCEQAGGARLFFEYTQKSASMATHTPGVFSRYIWTVAAYRRRSLLIDMSRSATGLTLR